MDSTAIRVRLATTAASRLEGERNRESCAQEVIFSGRLKTLSETNYIDSIFIIDVDHCPKETPAGSKEDKE
jgi:hypothetical protein